MIAPPSTEQELLERAENIAGKTLRQLATMHDVPVPEKLTQSKGWVGELIETCLGASAGPLPEPDFQDIGIELKTLPLNKNKLPKESTFICVVSLAAKGSEKWETSLVRKKLSRVLWVPVEADKSIPVGERRIGSAILWSPDRKEEKILRQDWEELTELIALGNLKLITSQHGKYLQIRPKAANAKALRNSHDEHGENILTLPRGFYLRSSFTSRLLNTL